MSTHREKMIALHGSEGWKKLQRQRQNKWRADNPEKAKAQYRISRRRYCQRHPEKLKTYKALYLKTENGKKMMNKAVRKWQNTPQGKIIANLRSRLNSVFDRKIVNNGKAIDFVGCSNQKLKSRIESLWPKDGGMTWKNYGRKKGVRCWHIDHIVPYAHFMEEFKSEEPARIKKAALLINHYTNLFPLWEDENYKKNDTKPKWGLVLGKSMWSDLHEKAFNCFIPENEPDDVS